MADMAFLLEPIPGEDPCGSDLRWDPSFLSLDQKLEAARAGTGGSVVDAEVVSGDTPKFEDLIEEAKSLLQRSKDLRILVIYIESRWREEGLAGFAEALEELVTVAETWPDANTGIYPRADPDDGDLGERVAPFGKLLNLVPDMVISVGWGVRPEISERQAIAEQLKGVFDVWSERLTPAFGGELPSSRQAWTALGKLISSDGGEAGVEDGAGGAAGPGGGGRLPDGDAWDLVERAAELMSQQDRHSPALPVLRMLSGWRSLGLVEIADAMKPSGVSLEQILESIKRQRDQQQK